MDKRCCASSAVDVRMFTFLFTGFLGLEQQSWLELDLMRRLDDILKIEMMRLLYNLFLSSFLLFNWNIFFLEMDTSMLNLVQKTNPSKGKVFPKIFIMVTLMPTLEFGGLINCTQRVTVTCLLPHHFITTSFLIIIIKLI